VEEDGIDVLEPDEAEDRDRLRARQRHGFEVGLLDEDVLTLRELPTLDELVGLDVALVHRAPALLLDRCAAFAMKRAKRDVLPLGRESKPDGDVDEAEADRSVPDGPHENPSLVRDCPISRFSSPSLHTILPMESRTTPELWRDAVRDAPDRPAYLEETADGCGRSHGTRARSASRCSPRGCSRAACATAIAWRSSPAPGSTGSCSTRREWR